MSKSARTLSKIVKPTPERAEKSPVKLAPKTIADARGNISQPYITLDVIDRMERRGTITKAEHVAASRFREDFRLAALDPLRAMPMEHSVQGGEREPLCEAAERARRRVAAAMQVFGGRTTPAGNLIWTVVGEEKTLKDWCAANSFGGRPICEEAASGMLRCGLGVLAAHYGY